MKAVVVTVQPQSPIGTPVVGDTLFGHLCWALLQRRGEAALQAALQGYTEGRPFVVVSDAFPAGYLPKPALPDWAAGLPEHDPRQRKLLRRRKWLPASAAHAPLHQWMAVAEDPAVSVTQVRTQNTINRLTGTTGKGAFAPRQVDNLWFLPGLQLDITIVFDPQRLDEALLEQLLQDIGSTGYGRDASAGLGKFTVQAIRPLPDCPAHTHAMALAPCAPVPDALLPDECWWLPTTRFGRHGNMAALGGGGGPFKRPILLMATGAVLAFKQPHQQRFFGMGLGGANAPLSGVIADTVHQGYAPLQPLQLAAAHHA